MLKNINWKTRHHSERLYIDVNRIHVTMEHSPNGVIHGGTRRPDHIHIEYNTQQQQQQPTLECVYNFKIGDTGLALRNMVILFPFPPRK